jgi:D-methionine transport system permease protein
MSMLHDLIKNTLETLYMVGAAGIISIFCGLLLGVYLFIRQCRYFKTAKITHACINTIVNSLRSIPFIILMIAVLPLTRLIAGTGIGDTATIVPLSLAATPFFARITETALKNLPAGLIEASMTLGATTYQTIVKILLPEAAADLVRGSTLTLIALIGYSAMAGAIGAGGLGNYAYQNGYERYDNTIILITVIVLIILVQTLQWIGDMIAKKLTH